MCTPWTSVVVNCTDSQTFNTRIGHSLNMAGQVAGKTAVVTGGASGIGRAIAITYAEEGANVVVADITQEPRDASKSTHEHINEHTDATAVYVDCDVTDTEDLETAIDAAEEFGGIDVMINNAGIFKRTDFFEVTKEEYDRILSINQDAVFFGCQAAARRMGDNGGGSIINISSIGGIQGFAMSSVYCMTKAAVKLLSYSLASELQSENIRVNAIHPGTIQTSMTVEDQPILNDEESIAEAEEGIALERVGLPEDVAGAAVFLASEYGSYINGESLLVDGGMVNIG